MPKGAFVALSALASRPKGALLGANQAPINPAEVLWNFAAVAASVSLGCIALHISVLFLAPRISIVIVVMVVAVPVSISLTLTLSKLTLSIRVNWGALLALLATGIGISSAVGSGGCRIGSSSLLNHLHY